MVLVYCNQNRDAITIVQYKMMEPESLKE